MFSHSYYILKFGHYKMKKIVVNFIGLVSYLFRSRRYCDTSQCRRHRRKQRSFRMRTERTQGR